MNRLSLRLARREVLRRPGRTALVALLVAIPVMGMVLSLVLLRTGTDTLDEQWQHQYGSADAVVEGGSSYRSAPRGTRDLAVAQTGGTRVLTHDGHRATVEIEDLSPTDELSAGRSELSAGRAPTTTGEIALTSEAMAKLHVGIGDDLELKRPGGTYEVVGEVAYEECVRCPRAVVAPGTIAQVTGGDARGFPGFELTLLDLPSLDAAELADLQASAETEGVGLMLRDRFDEGYYRDPQTVDASSISWTLVIGALVLTVVGIVISAAFAVGARRQLVTIGQLSASGAPPSSVRNALLLQGTVTGAFGSVAGVVLAAAVLLGLHDQVEFVLDQPIDRYRFSLPEIVAAALIGVAAATLAALLPARSAARIPTLAALAGRRPLPPVSGGLVAKGLVAIVAGLGLFGLAIVGAKGSDSDVWAYVAILGGVTEILGACAVAPAIVSRLEPLAHRLKGGLRLGARGLARQRARTGAVVSAVCAAGALAVAAGGAILGSAVFADQTDVRTPDDVVLATAFVVPTGPEAFMTVTPPSSDVLDALRDALPNATESTLRLVQQPSTDPTRRGWELHAEGAQGSPAAVKDVLSDGSLSTDEVLVADEATLDALRVSAAARAALRADGAVAIAPRLSGRAVLSSPGGTSTDVNIVPSRYRLLFPPTILVTEAFAQDHHLTVTDGGALFRSSAPLTADELDALDDIDALNAPGMVVEATAPSGVETSGKVTVTEAGGVDQVVLEHDYPRTGPTEAQLELILGGLALVFALFVVGVSLALAAAESKDERDILTIAGAPPATVARSAGARAWLMATIGAVMAVPVGFLPIVVVHLTSDQGGYVSSSFPLVFPSKTVAILVLAVPAIVAVVAYATSATAQRVRPVRISTATFE